MTSRSQKWHHPWLTVVIILLLILGIFFRFYHLDRKIYWHDEVMTSMRVGGHQRQEYMQNIFDGHVVTAADLQAYQYPRPGSRTTDLIEILAAENAHHPPLYYLIMRHWVLIWGHSLTTTRSLSALLSAIALPAFYWLCLELFASPLVSEIAVALMAISPLHLLYAQEARQYSLWVLLIVLSSAGLLKAIRVQTPLAWVTYAVALALGCYTFLFNGFVAVGHGLYMVFNRQTSVLKSYSLAILLATLLFLPWIIVIISTYQKVEQVTRWTTVPMVLEARIQAWGWNFSHLFFDVGLWPDHPLMALSTVLILVFVIYAIFYLCRQAPKRSWLLVVGLIGIVPLTLMSLDLVMGGQRSISARYFMPTYLGIEISVAYLLAHQLMSSKRQILWKGVTVLLFTVGLASCLTISQVESWWTKVVDPDNAYIARIINQAERPLVISADSDTNPASVISLSYLVEPWIRFQLVTDPNVPDIPLDFGRIFLFHPSETLQQGLVSTYQGQIKPVPKSSLLELTDFILPQDPKRAESEAS
jgi:uncharacterized membrane protein